MGLATLIKRRLPKRVRRSPKLLSGPGALPAVLAYNKHGGYCVPRSSIHRAACQTVLRGKVWEHDTVDYICAHADSGDIIHAGTYFGDFLPALSRAAGDHLIWAFEPAPENFRCAQVTVQINDLKNVRLHNAALGSSEAAIPFQMVDENGRPLGGWSRVSSSAKTTVPQLMLDRVIPRERKVGVVHLDVEFFEGEALKGARDLLQKDRPIVILENVPDGFADAYGYTFDRQLDANSIFLPKPVNPSRTADTTISF